MKILKSKKEGFYKVESAGHKGKFYEVDINKPFCSCPDFMFREIKKHGVCKHINAAREFAQKKKAEKASGKAARKGSNRKGEDIYKKTIDFVKEKGEADSMELIERFGEEIVDELIRKGELIEKKGKIRILS